MTLCYSVQMEIPAWQLLPGDESLSGFWEVFQVSKPRDQPNRVVVDLTSGRQIDFERNEIVRVQRNITCLEEPRLFTAIV